MALNQLEKCIEAMDKKAEKRYKTTILAEKSKLLFNLGRKEEAIKEVKTLLKRDATNEKMWVYLHIFTRESDPAISEKALFKAYDINSSSALVLNCLLSFYLRSGELSKFFGALQVANKLEH
jgi:tetratricopeptide (TPR) repeat protein